MDIFNKIQYLVYGSLPKKKKKKENYYIKFMDYCKKKKIIKVDIGKEMIKNEINFYH